MKDALIIFLVGIMTITMTITVITEVKDYKRTNKPEERFVCTNGGMPDWNCYPDKL
jgi:hypothetical protein